MVTIKKAKKEPSYENEFGEFLKAAREAKGFTLAEVAEELGLHSHQPVWDWENNKGAGVPAEMLVRLIKLYGISANDAYNQLMNFHQQRTKEKVRRKFEEAKVKILGTRKK